MLYGQSAFSPQSKICLICGSSKLTSYFAHASDSLSQATVSITECNVCNFAWQYPLSRNEKESIQYFESAYKDAGKTQSEYFNPDRKREIAKLEFEFIKEIPGENRRILDIGAGTGMFAEIASENGWQVTAVDPAMGIDRFSSNKNIIAIKGTFEDVMGQDSFDVVTLWDVIEHTINPMEVIAKSKKFIKDGGWLIIETGNFKSADRVAAGLNHWIYQLDHRWYFSPESIVELAKKMGFSEFIFSERELRPGWLGKADYSGPSLRNLLGSLIRQTFQARSHVSKYVSLRKARAWEMAGISIFTVAARKG